MFHISLLDITIPFIFPFISGIHSFIHIIHYIHYIYHLFTVLLLFFLLRVSLYTQQNDFFLLFLYICCTLSYSLGFFSLSSPIRKISMPTLQFVERNVMFYPLAHCIIVMIFCIIFSFFLFSSSSFICFSVFQRFALNVKWFLCV